MQYKFFALISRMRYIARWGLMRNTFQENIQEHSHMVAVLAHALALIERDILGGSADPDRCATAALFHDASEILTGDLPTPIKYYNPEIKKAYKQVEAVSCRGAPSRVLIETSYNLDRSFSVSVFGVVSPVSQRETACRVTKTCSASCSCERPFVVLSCNKISLVSIQSSPRRYFNRNRRFRQATRSCGAR